MTHKTRTGFVIALGIVALLATWQLSEAQGKDDEEKARPRLPHAAAAAIQKAFPKAKLGRVSRIEKIVRIYRVKLRDGDQDLEVEVFLNGEILTVRGPIERKDLPIPVEAALKKAAGDGKIEELEQKETHAIISIARLPKPQFEYTAEFERGDWEVEITMDVTGKILDRQVEANDHEDEGEDDD